MLTLIAVFAVFVPALMLPGPDFVAVVTPAWLLVVMVALVTLLSLTRYALVSLFLSSEPVLRRFQGARHHVERAAGVCFIALGGKVLADARTPVSP